MSENTHHPWYALKVRTRSEPVATASLQSRGFDPYAPTYKMERQYCDRKKAVSLPVFPGYLFCRFDAVFRSQVLNCLAVQSILGFHGVPSVVPDEQIDAVRRALAAGATPSPFLRVGQRVRILRGAMEGVEGVLIRHGGTDEVIVSVDLLQRSVSLRIDSDLLQAI